MTAKQRYIQKLLAHYRQLPGTLGRVLRDDRRTALALHDRRIDLDVVLHAFAIAIARRSFRADTDSLPTIRTLRYFLPVIEELAASPPDPGYLEHLRSRLRTAGLYPPGPA